MTKKELIKAMDEGKTVHWHNKGYICYRTKCGEYLKTFRPNSHTIGIFHKDGIGMNIYPKDCFIAEKPEFIAELI